MFHHARTFQEREAKERAEKEAREKEKKKEQQAQTAPSTREQDVARMSLRTLARIMSTWNLYIGTYWNPQRW